MVRGIKTPTRTTPAPKGALRSIAKASTAKAKALAPKATAAKVPAKRAPVVSKDELRAKVEKLEQTLASLRTKSREANRAAKKAAAHIAQLEEEVATLEKQVASQATLEKRSAKKSASRKSRDVDPGDAVPPGVTVAEPEPLDDEANTVLENLEEHLGDRSSQIM